MVAHPDQKTRGGEPITSATSAIPPDLLERIWFYTNFDCHLRCSYCVAGLAPGASRAPLDLAAFQRLVDQAVTLGFRQVALTGGEPFLHPDIATMLAYATSRSDTVVLTSAVPLTARVLRNLSWVDRSRLLVQVSLDSADPGANDRLRGPGSWRKATLGLEMLLEAGYNVAVRATLDGQNQETLPELVRFLATLGVPAQRVYGAPVANVGRTTHGLELSPERVWPEPTVVSDGLFWHPLLIEPPFRVARQIDPLLGALRSSIWSIESGRSSRRKCGEREI